MIGTLATACTSLDNVKSMHERRWVVGWKGSVWHLKPNAYDAKHANHALFGPDTSALKSPTTTTRVVSSQAIQGLVTPEHSLTVLNATTLMSIERP